MKTLNFFALISIFVIFVNCNEISTSSLTIKEALAAINPSYLNDIFLEGNIIKSKRDETQADANLIACQKEQDDFVDCIKTGNVETCNMIINGERCVNFFKDPASFLPSCEKYDHSTAQGLSAFYKYVGSINQLICVNNGDCTIAKEMIDKMKKSLGNIKATNVMSPSEEALNSDCNRRECVEAAINMYEKQREVIEINLEVDKGKNYDHTEEEMKHYNELLSMADKFLELLYSCTPKSGAVKIIASNILLISIITVFIIFLVK